MTIEWNKDELDLKVPKKVTLDRLNTLIKETFLAQGHPLPETLSLQVKDKTFLVQGSDRLCDLGIGGGEKMELIGV